MEGSREPLADGNIQLDYRLSILFTPGMETILYADGAEVFADEQGVQWVKFFAKNGPGAGKEHMVRTDSVVIVKQD